VLVPHQCDSAGPSTGVLRRADLTCTCHTTVCCPCPHPRAWQAEKEALRQRRLQQEAAAKEREAAAKAAAAAARAEEHKRRVEERKAKYVSSHISCQRMPADQAVVFAFEAC
jgi:hypothetical protein